MTIPRPSLEGRHFASVDNGSGEVGAETVFAYHEDPETGEVWAHYAGGSIVRGQLLGRRTTADKSDTLDFRYVQLTVEGTTSSGHCVSTVEQLHNGRLRLHETWQWESRSGSGTSTLEELPAP